MHGDVQTLRTYLLKLSFSWEIADIYFALYVYGQQTISQLAQRSGVERTRIYRLMDELQASGLVEIEVQYKRKIFRAAPISNLQIMLAKKEQDLRDLQKDLGSLQHTLEQDMLKRGGTKVQIYHGTEGLKQMFWNQTRSKTENLSILYENMQSRTKLAFFERWVRLMNERHMKSRSIMCDNFVKTQKEWYDIHSNERLKDWTGRYIPSKVFPITHSTVIYNDVTSYYTWKDNEIFGIEIYNQDITNAQRQFFEMLWNQGHEIDELNVRNASV